MADPDPRTVDPWRFAGSFVTRLLSSAIPKEPTHLPIPWTPVTRPLSESRVALLSTAGISMADDEPFDMELERTKPMQGDPTWRRISADATGDAVAINHLHIDTSYIRRDLNVALPLDRLRELVASGHVGAVADTHYSTMGYQGGSFRTLEQHSAPEIAASMKREQVDLAILAPV